MIGVVTMFIGDMASLLGCCLCIPDDITAITFVALGTSLPDTFASKTAATQDPHADASVGNVTGSNSVNVFLGLGLPWAIASIKWAMTSGSDCKWDMKYQAMAGLDSLGTAGSRTLGFVVEAGNLSFSVGVFSTCAMCCIILLAVRRQAFGGELGGPAGPKWASAGFLLFLWLIYIILSSWMSLSDGGSGAFCPH
jgi:Ca2+/Na+ antiporter